MFKFKRNTKKLLGEIQISLDEISDDLDDIKSDINELHESVAESLRLTLDIQEQCQQIINMMEKNKGEKNE